MRRSMLTWAGAGAASGLLAGALFVLLSGAPGPGSPDGALVVAVWAACGAVAGLLAGPVSGAA
jgi:hypothetical protein